MKGSSTPNAPKMPTHKHYCRRCETQYGHDGHSVCLGGFSRLCDACWDVFRRGALHPSWGKQLAQSSMSEVST